MLFGYPEGIRVDVTSGRQRCSLCGKLFLAGDTVTIGADRLRWDHKCCYLKQLEEAKESTKYLFTR